MQTVWLSTDSCMVKTLLGRHVCCSDNASLKKSFRPCVFSVVAKTTEVDGLRFKDKDLETVGTLEYGQFGVVGEMLIVVLFRISYFILF
jgi:hypothetical protein